MTAGSLVAWKSSRKIRSVADSLMARRLLHGWLASQKSAAGRPWDRRTTAVSRQASWLGHQIGALTRTLQVLNAAVRQPDRLTGPAPPSPRSGPCCRVLPAARRSLRRDG